ncbi:MAG: trypsin-like peptidase domain-containing protein [Oscillospiraceae bacterium]|nr:trypsin-like peptidase domain-containing protein [Oscillospiraceae bacterium]
MEEKNPIDVYGSQDTQSDSRDAESPVLYRQISYEELEECVFIVRDSISEFYLAPQGEISYAAVEAALHGQGDVANAPMPESGAGPQNGNIVQNDMSSADDPLRVSALADVAAEGDMAFGSQGADGGALRHWPDGAMGDLPEQPNQAELSHKPDPGELVAQNGQVGQPGQPSQPSQPGALEQPIQPSRSVRPLPPVIRISGRGPLQQHTIPIHQIYRESVQKRKKKRRATTVKYLAASFCGAVFGGLLVILCIAVILPFFGRLVFAPEPGSVHEVIHTIEYAKADTQIEAIYEKVSPSVVGIRVAPDYSEYAYGQQRGAGGGSGIIIHSDGYILTNNHVIAAAIPLYAPYPRDGGAQGEQAESKIDVVIQRDPGVVYSAQLVARDVKTDVAVIKIDAINLPVAELGDSDLIKPGELVVAIGRPGSMDNICSVADGIISGFNRGASEQSQRETGLIQTNAAINTGNSGGALVNARGQVIGINVISSDTYGYEGMNFAIPINSARNVAENLIDFSYVRGRAKTGIGFSESYNDNFEFYEKQYPGIPKGVYVSYVEPLSGAFTAGMRVGDIIVKMHGTDITHYMEMLEIKDSLAPGDIIDVEVFRSGEYIAMSLEVSEEAGDDPGAY